MYLTFHLAFSQTVCRAPELLWIGSALHSLPWTLTGVPQKEGKGFDTLLPCGRGILWEPAKQVLL